MIYLQPRVDSALQDELNQAMDDLQEANHKLEKKDKKIKRIEEALDIKEDENLTLSKFLCQDTF